MSWRASAYVKDLVVCPNGEPITRAEKLVLFVLADYHQDKMGAYTYPSILQIAPKALCTKDTCSDALASLEDKGVLECVKPARQGRGQVTYYVFLELDKVDEKGVEIP